MTFQWNSTTFLVGDFVRMLLWRSQYTCLRHFYLNPFLIHLDEVVSVMTQDIVYHAWL